jgi:hypothetical protein
MKARRASIGETDCDKHPDLLKTGQINYKLLHNPNLPQMQR